MIVSPRPRTRPPVVVASTVPAPRARTRPTTPASATEREVRDEASWRTIIPDALPLPFLRKTHNGYDPKAGEMPDPRFAPLVIVMPADWKDRMPEWAAEQIKVSLTWEAGPKFPDPPIYAVPAFITEWALRHYTGKALLADDVYASLEAFIVEQEGKWNPPQRHMLRIEDGTVACDMTKGAGPFYLDKIMAMEIHYAKILRPLQNSA